MKVIAPDSNVNDTSYTFPQQLLTPGKKYKLRVCSVGRNGALGKSVTTATFTV